MFHGGKKCRPNGATKEKKLTAVQMMLRFITAANKLALTLSGRLGARWAWACANASLRELMTLQGHFLKFMTFLKCAVSKPV